MKTNKELPEVIDLFSGCGGLALGFKQAGFDIPWGIELMENAAKNANYNLSVCYGHKPGHICGDITEMKGDMFADKGGKNGYIVIGGPPCQAYSLIGRAKINSLREEGSFEDDKRGYLFEDYLRFVVGHNARAVVMENVRQSTSYGNINVPEKVASFLERNGYTAWWTILNAADFGVPQVRERMILFAVKGKVKPRLPIPTHCGKSYDMYFLFNGENSFSECKHYIPPLKAEENLPPWRTVEEAIGDLPSLRISPNQPFAANSMNLQLPYEDDAENEYQEMLRGDRETVSGNVYHNNERDYPIFARMQEDDLYPQALAIARQILAEKCLAQGIREGTPEYEEIKKSTVPPYSEDKFLSKWKRINRDKPCHTLVAHMALDTYSHIHPWEPRGISVREAARIQSFPDDYAFQSNMGEAFRQIGNSVPPLMAKALAENIKILLQEQEKN